jgi:hypothetical protein
VRLKGLLRKAAQLKGLRLKGLRLKGLLAV